MTAVDEELPDEDEVVEGEDVDPDDVEQDADSAEDFDEDETIEGFDEDFDAEDGEDDEAVGLDETLSSKEQSARQLAIRRAIEERREARKMSEDLDYLDYDLDD